MTEREDTGAGLRELAVAAYISAAYGSKFVGMTAKDWLEEATVIVRIATDPVEGLRTGVGEGLGEAFDS